MVTFVCGSLLLVAYLTREPDPYAARRRHLRKTLRGTRLVLPR